MDLVYQPTTGRITTTTIPITNIITTRIGITGITTIITTVIGIVGSTVAALSPKRVFWDLPSHRKYQRRILPVVLITETERQRLWRARGIILAKIWLVEVFEQIDWSGVGTKEP